MRSKEKIHCGGCECNQFFLFVNELHGFLYLFSQKENEEWLFDANYSYDYENPRVEFENKKVNAKDASTILDVVKKQDLILQAQKYKPPRIKAFVLDGGGYYLYFKMNDGTEINAEIYNEDLVNELRTLAEKCRKS